MERMTSEKKYYEPTVEEFHVGFEFESHIDNGLIPKQLYEEGQEWKATAWQVGDFFKTDKPKGLRVKHLDREDIESLGWEFQGKNSYMFDKKYWLIFEPNNGHISIEEGDVIGDFQDSEFLFQGKLKNKSELKRLMAQLGII